MHAHSERRYWIVAILASLGLHSVAATAAAFYFQQHREMPAETEISILSVPLDRASPTAPSQTLSTLAPGAADVLRPEGQETETLTHNRSVQVEAQRRETAMPLGRAEEQATLVPRAAENARPVEARERAAAVASDEAARRAEPRDTVPPTQAGEAVPVRQTMDVAAAAAPVASAAAGAAVEPAQPRAVQEQVAASEVRETAASSPVTRTAPVLPTDEAVIASNGAAVAAQSDISDMAEVAQPSGTVQPNQTVATAASGAVDETAAAASAPIVVERSPTVVASSIQAETANPAANGKVVPPSRDPQLATAQASGDRATVANRSASLQAGASGSRAALAERAASAPALPRIGTTAAAPQTAEAAAPAIASATGRSQAVAAARMQAQTAAAAQPAGMAAATPRAAEAAAMTVRRATSSGPASGRGQPVTIAKTRTQAAATVPPRAPLQRRAGERAEPAAAAPAPRVAAVVAPARPGSLPGVGLDEPNDPAREVIDFVRQYDGGDCFAALPAATPGGEARVQTFGDNEAVQAAFRRALSGSTGISAEIHSGTVAGTQCLALSFAREVDRYPEFSLAIDLDAAETASGAQLSGTVRNAGDRFLHLLLIDDDGLVQNVDPYLAAAAGHARRFSAPVVLIDGPVATEQLLMAIASDRPIGLLQGPVRRPASSFFNALAAEISAANADVDLAVEGFSVY